MIIIYKLLELKITCSKSTCFSSQFYNTNLSYCLSLGIFLITIGSNLNIQVTKYFAVNNK